MSDLLPDEIENPITIDPGVEAPTNQGIYGYDGDEGDGDDA